MPAEKADIENNPPLSPFSFSGVPPPHMLPIHIYGIFSLFIPISKKSPGKFLFSENI
jgi:hypothetical protein